MQDMIVYKNHRFLHCQLYTLNNYRIEEKKMLRNNIYNLHKLYLSNVF